MSLPASSDLHAVAASFALPAPVTAVAPLGQGNVNDTYRVETAGGARFVLQRLNTTVFRRPDLVMANITVLNRHLDRHPERHAGSAPGLEVPRAIAVAGPSAASSDSQPTYHLERDGAVWRLLTYVENAVSHDTVQSAALATELGRALGRFHRLIHDLPCDDLADTLEGFHITPRYLEAYRQVLARRRQQRGDAAFSPGEHQAMAFVEARQDLAAALESAREAGLLQLRPIHGDPKVNNVMLDAVSGRARALVDLDTVKPGLLQYDIGDCLRSGCNPAGEECGDLDAVHFDLERCRAILTGYLEEAGRVLSPADYDHLYVAARLISFELGLRFLSDHLDGDRYFKVRHPGHNLQRALVQFRLTASIEEQEEAIQALVTSLRR